jgi:hypothetical protein
MQPPRLYVTANHSGDVGKSTSLASLGSLYLSQNVEILLGVADVNMECQRLLRKDVGRVDLPDEDAISDLLLQCYDEAVKENLPVLLDLPARGSTVLATDIVTSNPMLNAFEVIGLVPVRADGKTIAGALSALDELRPSKFILFERKPRLSLDPARFPDLADLRERASGVVEVPQLTPREIMLLRNAPCRVDQLQSHIVSLPMPEQMGYWSLCSYWQKIEQQLMSFAFIKDDIIDRASDHSLPGTCDPAEVAEVEKRGPRGKAAQK